MNIIAISDFHGQLPEIKDCDLLLIAGDICPLEHDRDLNWCLKWLDKEYREWLKALSARGIDVVGIAGNHDFVFESRAEDIAALDLPWIYLENSSCEVNGVEIYGTPNI